jgi:hypothetical protein
VQTRNARIYEQNQSHNGFVTKECVTTSPNPLSVDCGERDWRTRASAKGTFLGIDLEQKLQLLSRQNRIGPGNFDISVKVYILPRIHTAFCKADQKHCYYCEYSHKGCRNVCFTFFLFFEDQGDRTMPPSEETKDDAFSVEKYWHTGLEEVD